MNPFDEDIMHRAQEYCEKYAVQFDRRLGFGKDGTVWQSTGMNAVKVFRRPEPYQRELAAYQRLQERGIVDLRGHKVPQLIRHDDHLLTIEITIVRRPFILDFGSAYLDHAAPEFPDDIMEEWLARKMRDFGPNWSRAASILLALQSLGIHMTDVHPGNIGFEEEFAAGGSSSD